MIGHLKRAILFFCSFVTCIIVSATNTVGWQTAAAVLGTEALEMRLDTQSYTVYVPMSGVGYVIMGKVGGERVIGYSRESRWNVEDFPLMVQEWLHSRDTMTESAQHSVRAIGEAERHTIQPLISTQWHQRSPYNDYAPYIADGNIKTVAGCVAIAAAQITYYWWRDNPDATLKDTPTYKYSKAPVVYSIPKGTPNDWELIKDTYTTQDSRESRDAAARLCYVLGTTSYLDYASSTGGHIDTAAKAMYSQYGLLSEYMSKAKCTYDEWDALLYHELSHGRPVLCAGDGSGGHAFVLDGYDRERRLYHFNFGWGGDGDGYYPVDNSPLAMGGYYQDQTIVYNIHPQKRNMTADLSPVGPDPEGYILHVDVTNGSTLPAELSIMALNAKTGKEMSVWTALVDNGGERFTADIVIPYDKLVSVKELKVVDEYNTPLADCTIDLTAIDAPAVKESTDSEGASYNLDGRRHREGNKGIYITPSGHLYQKRIR